MAAVPFATQAYTSRSLPLMAQRCLNLYAEQAPADAKSPIFLVGAPGLDAFADTGEAAIRGTAVFRGALYAAAGTSLYRVTAVGGASAVGALPGSGDVFMAASDDELLVLVGSAAFVWDGATLTQVTSAGYLGGSSVDYVDGYFVFTKTGTPQFFISGLNDGLAYDALDFASADGGPDNLVRVLVDHREVWLFGELTTEVWFNTGADFPFERHPSGFMEKGIAGKYAVAKIDNTVFWLGHDRMVYRASGFQPQRVSTHAIERILEDADDLSDARMFAYAMDGHSFVVLTLPSADPEDESPGMTFVFDAATGLWHQRASYQLGFWRPWFYEHCYGTHLVGDSQSGKIFELDLDTFTDDGDPILWEAAAAPLHANGAKVNTGILELELETGVGLTTGQGSDPQIMLDWSDDGGRTFGAERWRSMGKIGEYKRRVRWTRLGSFRSRIYRIRGSDPVKRIVIGANP